MISNVYIGRVGPDGYEQQIRTGLNYIDIGGVVTPGTRVFIKPNLTYPTFLPGVMTTPQALEAVIVALREYTQHIYVGDADSGGYNRFSMNEVYRETGVAEVARKYGVKLVNLSECERKTIHFQYKRKRFALDLPHLLTDEMDFFITMPVPKIHNMTGVSLGFKNQWGCIPEPQDRLRLHPFFQHVIVEVNRAVKTRMVIMDGQYGLNDNGPMLGRPVKLGWVMVADGLGAADRVACELMQVPVRFIRHLRYAQQLGLVPELHEIALNCSLKPFIGERFLLKRVLTDLPGYLAFNSPVLAWIAYFSPMADLLHKLLYLFRKPFYDYDRYAVKSKSP